jgi:protein-tyrosine phosphatase
VRWGALYRSDSLGKLPAAGPDWDRFLGLGVRTVIDLRYPWEVDRSGRVPHQPGLAYHNLSIEHRPYDQAAQGPDVDPGPFLAAKFAEVADDGAKEIRQALDVITDGAGPVVFHCQSGKDRTGLLAALVLALLGVAEDDIIADFTLTERATERLVAEWHTTYPGRTLRWPGYGRAPADVMRLFLADLAARHGSVRGYAAERLGVSDARVDSLRRRYLAG